MRALEAVRLLYAARCALGQGICVWQAIDCTRYVQVQQLVEGGASELNGVRVGDVLLRIVRLIAI